MIAFPPESNNHCVIVIPLTDLPPDPGVVGRTRLYLDFSASEPSKLPECSESLPTRMLLNFLRLLLGHLVEILMVFNST